MGFHGFDPKDSWLFPSSKGASAVPIRSRIMFDTIEPAIDAGVAGMGRRHPLRQEVLAEFAPPEVPLLIIHHHDELVPLKVRVFIEFTAPRLQARRAL